MEIKDLVNFHFVRAELIEAGLSEMQATAKALASIDLDIKLAGECQKDFLEDKEGTYR